jgi:hypothetical protein
MASLLTRLPRRAVAAGALAALVITAGVAVLVGGCGGGGSTPTDAVPTRAVPLGTIFEAQSQLLAAPGPTLDELKRLGVDDVKVFVPWGELAPNALSRAAPAHFDATSPGAYLPAAWAPYDALVEAAKTRGIGVDLALEGPAPLWATAPGVPPKTASSFLGAWKPSATAYGAFVTAVADRYSGNYKPAGQSSPLPRVDFWSIWNEPNYGQQLAPQAIDDSSVEVSPVYYRALLNAAWTALAHTGHGHDTILIGELAPRGQTTPADLYPGDFSGMVPLRFIRALYCVDQKLKPLQGDDAAARGCPTTADASKSFAADNPGLFHASGFAFHPYPQGFAPNVRTPDEPDYADLPQVPELERTLDGAITAYGSTTRFPLYDTEFGYQTNPPETITRAINPKLAAAYANQAEYMSWRNPRIVSWDQYLLTDPAPGPGSFDTGLEYYNGTKKALYNAFRLPLFLPVTKTSKGHALEVWGCVRPAHYLIGHSPAPQVALIQFKPTTGAEFRTVERVTLTDPYGYFDVRATFPSSGLVRIAWSHPHSAQVRSRTVPITIR